MSKSASSARRSGKLHLGLIMDGAGSIAEGWRRAGVQSDASVDIHAYVAQARRAEAAGLDFVFVADSLHITAEAAPHLLNRLEPLTLLSAVAMATSRIGLVATIGTMYAEPFTVARQIASLDLISSGRAGWNIVTSAVKGAALNHSRAADFGASDRYRRADEHVATCLGLWDSWEPDAFVYDKENGVFFDRAKLHTLNHVGPYYQSTGPLNIQASRQGRPVLFQAGASSEGRDLAARYGDAIFAMASNMAAAKSYSNDVRSRASRFARAANDLVFMPRISPIIAPNERNVDDLYRDVTRLAKLEDALHALGLFFGGHDFSRHRLDAPFPASDLTVPEGRDHTSKDGILAYIETTSPKVFVERASARKLTLREAALEFMVPKTEFMGTPDQVADAIERWFQASAADGFIIRGGDFDSFSRLCIPILQERGLFRTDYEADTLRGNLGLPPIENRYVAAHRQQNAPATAALPARRGKKREYR